MPTCMGGMLPNLCAEGLCNCRVPFYVFPPTGGTTKDDKIGFITKIWAGLGTELFTDAAKFEVSTCEKRSLRVAPSTRGINTEHTRCQHTVCRHVRTRAHTLQL